MPLVGNLRDFALHDFLYLVDRGYKTGSLLLRTQTDSAALYFDRGKLTSVARPQRHEPLGELLIRTGKITREQLQQALDAQEATNVRPIGKILVEQGVITEANLLAVVQVVIEETVYDLFTWHEGEFEFKADLRPAPDEIQTPVPIAVENLIMEGVRRVDELTRIRERIPNNDVVVRFTPLRGASGGEASLSAAEWRIFARVDNRSSIDDLAQKLNLSPFEVSRIVFGLIVTGLLEVVPPEQPKAPSVPPTTPTEDTERVPRDAEASVAGPDGGKRGGFGRFIDRIRGS